MAAASFCVCEKMLRQAQHDKNKRYSGQPDASGTKRNAKKTIKSCKN